MRDLMEFYPELAVQQGEYRYAAEVTIPDSAWQGRELAYLRKQAKELARFEPSLGAVAASERS